VFFFIIDHAAVTGRPVQRRTVTHGVDKRQHSINIHETAASTAKRRQTAEIIIFGGPP